MVIASDDVILHLLLIVHVLSGRTSVEVATTKNLTYSLSARNRHYCKIESSHLTGIVNAYEYIETDLNTLKIDYSAELMNITGLMLQCVLFV